ncbi:hypothetical protein, partial [Vibrio cholerae]|uniref:hypothetical protein n=1 Tax=Vibrio cholerae TaxID=666 RepID=UPI001C2FFDBE
VQNAPVFALQKGYISDSSARRFLLGDSRWSGRCPLLSDSRWSGRCPKAKEQKRKPVTLGAVINSVDASKRNICKAHGDSGRCELKGGQRKSQTNAWLRWFISHTV